MQVTDEEITFRKSELVGWGAKMSKKWSMNPCRQPE